uniref:Infection structure-specific protein 24 n=1 Tax=Uromyces appendiculatus TaxID=5264 RepID=INF24_UROAP|nr:RecName: Full=Infection structure-specific protein 24 [Uromyces appendiculatus]
MSASSQQQQSASSSSVASFNGGGFGGGLGIGGGFGGFGGMSSFNAQSSSSYSSSTVINSFASLGSQIAAIQGMMAGGSFTQTIAMQQMSQLAVSMQLALTQSAGCSCLTQVNSSNLDPAVHIYLNRSLSYFYRSLTSFHPSEVYFPNFRH